MTEEEIYGLLPSISNGLNSLSVASSLVVLISITIVGLYRREMVNRTTLRLQVAISLIDLLNAIFALYHHTVKSGPFCIFIGFWRNFGEQMYCFLNIAMAVNLQLIFLHGKTPSRKWEYFYWLVPISIASLLSFLPLGLGFYGLNDGKVCYIIESLPGAKAMLFVDTPLTYMLTCLYLLVVTIFVNFKLTRANNSLNIISNVSSDTDVNEKFKQHLKTIIFRISLYPIFCIFGLSGFIVAYLNIIGGGKRKLWISIWGMTGISTKGFFNMFTFFLDPTFQDAAIMTYRDIFNKHKKGDHAKEFDHALESRPSESLTINYDAFTDSKSKTTQTGSEVTHTVNGNEIEKFL